MIRGGTIAVILLLGSMTPMSASPDEHRSVCIAKVLKTEEFAYAPRGYWLVRVTFEITPRDGPAFDTSLQDMMPWQAYAPRERQTFRLRCGRVLRLVFVKGRIADD
jgi:hypothetical protein